MAAAAFAVSVTVPAAPFSIRIGLPTVPMLPAVLVKLIVGQFKKKVELVVMLLAVLIVNAVGAPELANVRLLAPLPAICSILLPVIVTAPLASDKVMVSEVRVNGEALPIVELVEVRLNVPAVPVVMALPIVMLPK